MITILIFNSATYHKLSNIRIDLPHLMTLEFRFEQFIFFPYLEFTSRF
jgi:hypothetical protein